MSYLTSEGVSIYWESAGQGPTILLTHGYGATSEMWRGQVSAFQNRYRLITWDIRGHGVTDSPEDQSEYSQAKSLSDMRQILDACQVERAVLGGLSLGGYLSLEFHYAYSNRVRALVLCDTGPGYRNPETREKWNEMGEDWARKFESGGLRVLLEGSSEWKAATTHRSADGLVKAARGMFKQVDSRIIDFLPSIQVPTLVVVGANDDPLIAASKYMAAKIPNARLVVVPDAGHAPNIDQPAIFNAALREFLDGLS